MRILNQFDTNKWFSNDFISSSLNKSNSCSYTYSRIQPSFVSTCTTQYRYGMNGQEKDDEIVGSAGSIYSAEYWMYDSRLGRRWNLDPKPQISISDYACFANNPVYYSDPNGASATPPDKILHDDKTGDVVGYQEDANGKEFVTDVYGHWTDDKKGFVQTNEVTPEQKQWVTDMAKKVEARNAPNAWQKAMYKSMDQFEKGLAVTAVALPALPVALEFGLLSLNANAASAAAGGLADFANQMMVNKGNIQQVNWTSVAASTILKNPFSQAAVGSALEVTIDGGMSNSVFGDKKTLSTGAKEVFFGTMGNMIGGKGGKIGSEMFDMGGKTSKFIGETFGQMQGQFIGTAGTKATTGGK